MDTIGEQIDLMKYSTFQYRLIYRSSPIYERAQMQRQRVAQVRTFKSLCAMFCECMCCTADATQRISCAASFSVKDDFFCMRSNSSPPSMLCEHAYISNSNQCSVATNSHPTTIWCYGINVNRLERMELRSKA